ncbi:hypothetical protein Tco_0451296 [Tanacetum coccineum]
MRMSSSFFSSAFDTCKVFKILFGLSLSPLKLQESRHLEEEYGQSSHNSDESSFSKRLGQLSIKGGKAEDTKLFSAPESKRIQAVCSFRTYTEACTFAEKLLPASLNPNLQSFSSINLSSSWGCSICPDRFLSPVLLLVMVVVSIAVMVVVVVIVVVMVIVIGVPLVAKERIHISFDSFETTRMYLPIFLLSGASFQEHQEIVHRSVVVKPRYNILQCQSPELLLIFSISVAGQYSVVIIAFTLLQGI